MALLLKYVVNIAGLQNGLKIHNQFMPKILCNNIVMWKFFFVFQCVEAKPLELHMALRNRRNNTLNFLFMTYSWLIIQSSFATGEIAFEIEGHTKLF